MGKTNRHEKEWGSNRRPQRDDFWDEEEEQDYTVSDFFRGVKNPRIYCKQCGYSDVDDLTPIASHHRSQTMCPGCGGPAIITYD